MMLVIGQAVYYSANTVFEQCFIEVDEQAEMRTTWLEVGEYLRKVNIVQSITSLHLNDNLFLRKKFDTVAQFEFLVTVIDR